MVFGAFRRPYSVNCLVNSSGPNYSVTFAENSIDSPGGILSQVTPYFRTGLTDCRRFVYQARLVRVLDNCIP